MKRKDLTTGIVAGLCHVTTATVCNWVKEGKLRAYRTPGQHYRIRRADFQAFVERYKIPVGPGDFLAREKRSVLVVDDEPQVVSLVIRILKSRFPAFVFSAANDGYEAGVSVATLKPDLVILDLMMPGMDGFEVCRRIKGAPATSKTKVLIITGYPEDQNAEHALACGADDFMLKPLVIDALIDKVSALLTGDAAQAAAPGRAGRGSAGESEME